MTEPEPDARPEPNPLNDPAAAVSPTATDVRRRRARREHESQDEVSHSPVARANPERASKALENAKACARIADHNRGKDVLLLDLRKATSLVDFFVIATATSRRQGNAIADEADQEMKRRGERKLGLEGAEEGKWVLIDYGDFVVHVFSPETRAFYSIEEIWGDADRLDWQEAPPVPAPGPDSNPTKEPPA